MVRQSLYFVYTVTSINRYRPHLPSQTLPKLFPELKKILDAFALPPTAPQSKSNVDAGIRGSGGAGVTESAK